MQLLMKKVIVQAIAEKENFFPKVFLLVKKYGSYRMILNLKKLNEYIDSKHFKMESIQNAFVYGHIRGLDGFCGSQRCILFCPSP